MRSWFGTAITLNNTEQAISFLKSIGYKNHDKSIVKQNDFSATWEAWLSQNLPNANGVLVFGHDFEPIFIFKKIG